MLGGVSAFTCCVAIVFAVLGQLDVEPPVATTPAIECPPPPTARQFRGFKVLMLAKLDDELLDEVARLTSDGQEDARDAFERIEDLRGVRSSWEHADKPIPRGCSDPCNGR